MEIKKKEFMIGLKKNKRIKWPFSKMEPGDVVTYPMTTDEEISLAKLAQSRCHIFGHPRSVKFETSQATSNGEPCMMIHRVK